MSRTTGRVETFVYRQAVRPLALVQHSVAAQAALVLITVALVLWAVLFSNYPLVHDTFHQLRHGLYLVPCH